jgi:hypothetical protein
VGITGRTHYGLGENRVFSFQDGEWVYKLSTEGLPAGTYTMTIEMPDQRRFVAGFVLRAGSPPKGPGALRPISSPF